MATGLLPAWWSAWCFELCASSDQLAEPEIVFYFVYKLNDWARTLSSSPQRRRECPRAVSLSSTPTSMEHGVLTGCVTLSLKYISTRSLARFSATHMLTNLAVGIDNIIA